MFLISLRNFLTLERIVLIVVILAILVVLLVKYKALRIVYYTQVYFIRAIYQDFSHHMSKIIILKFMVKNIDAITSNVFIKILIRFAFIFQLYNFTSVLTRYRAIRFLPFFLHRGILNNIYFTSIFSFVVNFFVLSVVQEIIADSEIFTLKLWV